MPIQWFPGHMHATKKAIQQRMAEIDVVVELLDARLPGSSANPLLAELIAGKPTLKILNKQDLADPEITSAWLTHYNSLPGTQALALDASVSAVAQKLVSACRALAPHRGGMVKPLRVLICGIPNVGKSTLINTLLGQRAAHTGDEPGITKTEQRISLANDFYAFDTPGMLWPRITVEQSGYNLAASGGIGRNAYDEEEVALELLARVRPRYNAGLQKRYALADISTLREPALLAEVGRKRGGLMTGGRINLQKAAEVVINDLRSGAWGRVSLESPAEFAQWQQAGQARELQRQAKQAARQQGKRGSRQQGQARQAPGEGAAKPLARRRPEEPAS
jgi:ribosome biogenesis GTPase A